MLIRRFVYLLLLLVGAIGFVALVGLGFIHGSGHHGHSHGHGHANGHGMLHHGPTHAAVGHAHHGPVHHGPVHHGPAHHGHGNGHHHDSNHNSWFLISPLDIFALSLGAGATGILLGKSLTELQLGVAAAAGALVLNYGIIKPLMRLLMRFASTPSEGLEGAVATCAQAATAFDEHGQGVVKLTIDGQVVQLLATLADEELSQGVRVKKGEEVVIIEVNATRNTCRVTKELQFPELRSNL